MTDSSHSTPSGFRRTNLLLWALIATLGTFVVVAQFIPAHWVLGGVVVLLLTRPRRGADPTEPDTHGDIMDTPDEAADPEARP